MATETASAFARRMARQAFDAGLRAAGQPPSERDRRRADAESYTDTMLAGLIDSEIERRQAEAAS